jgi:hypothetical protein
LIDENWKYAEYNAREYQTTMKAKRREAIMEMVAQRIAETKGNPGLIAERLAEEIVRTSQV